MAAIHRDDVSAPARLFQAALAERRAAQRGRPRRPRTSCSAGMPACRPDSAGAACYSRLRWALARIVASRSGLAADARQRARGCRGGVSAVSHLWWMLPALLRSGDLALTGGGTWHELLAEALEVVSGETPDVPWHQLHAAALTHPLTPLLPGAPPDLSPRRRGGRRRQRDRLGQRMPGRVRHGGRLRRGGPLRVRRRRLGQLHVDRRSAAHPEIRPARTTSISTRPGPGASSSRCATTGT